MNLLLFFLLVMEMLNPLGVDMECVDKADFDELGKHCKFKLDFRYISCINLNSTDVLNKLPRDLICLTIKRSNITHLKGGLLRNCTLLSTLKLKNNEPFTFSSDFFVDVGDSLKELQIESNKNLDLSYDITLFVPLKHSLKSLIIFKNSAVKLSQEIFEPLESLTNLVIGGDVVKSFNNSFSKLVSLNSLKIVSPFGNITNDTFIHITSNLTHLKLLNAHVTFLESGAFHPLKNLTYLDLSYNYDLTLSNVEPTLKALSNNIKVLKLNFITGYSQPTLKLTDEFFGALHEKSKLKKLSISKNDIIYINWQPYHSLKHLEYFDISYNRLSNVFYLMVQLFLMVQLKEIEASYQSKRYPGGSKKGSTLTNYYDEYDEQHDYVEMSNNDAYEDFYRNKTTKPCKVKNTIKCRFPKNFKVGDMSVDSWCIPCPKNLKIARLNGVINTDTKDLPTILLLGDCPIEEFHLQRNGFVRCGGQVMMDRPTARIPILVDLSFNSISCFAPNIFKFSIQRNLSIGTLLLEGNNLAEQMAGDKGSTFHLYKKLEVLNLADNRIKIIPERVFESLVNLKILNLSRNFLQVLLFDVSKLTKLKFLDLSENSLVMVDGTQQAIFTYMSQTRGYFNFTVSLLNNPLQCSCSTIDFLSWIVSNATHIHQFRDLTCMYYKKDITLADTNSINRYLKLFCYATLPLEIAGSLIGLAIICSFVGMVVYKYRWDIRYYMLKKAQSKREYHLSMNSKVNYLYDAFVCYDKSDAGWVVQELIVNLEYPGFAKRKFKEMMKRSDDPSIITSSNNSTFDNCGYQEDPQFSLGNDDTQRSVFHSATPNMGVVETTDTSDEDGLHLCIHERDFEPGLEIESNITMALENSRKVILVVSSNFLRSRWCHLELEMAKMESLVRRVNMIVTVFLDPIEEGRESLEWLTKYYTYLEWHKYDDYRRHEFWRRLRTAIGLRKENKETNNQAVDE